MKSYRIFAAALALATVAGMAGFPVCAQITTASTVTVKQKPRKAVWLKAEVVHADARSMIVREQASSITIHTFTYAPGIQDRMQSMADNGGYQSGDKVNILHMPGETVALKIHGKPSKPL
jgi:hypothetical protein